MTISFGLKNTLFTNVCNCCKKRILNDVDLFCQECSRLLVETNYHDISHNVVAQKFDGLVPITAASSCFYFEQDNLVKELLHEIKYLGNEDLAERIGRYYASKLTKTIYATYDIIIPVPLHAIKKEQRGFNQSEAFGRGLSEGLGVELKIDILKRIKYTETQTKKTRQERIDNVMGVFEVTHPDLIKEKKIILVDDVITTGVTLEIAANELMKYHPKELSILTIACAGGV